MRNDHPILVGRCAIHETGHVLIAVMLGGASPSYVSVIAGGDIGGWCWPVDFQSVSDEVTFLAAGDAAELICDPFTGNVPYRPRARSRIVAGQNFSARGMAASFADGFSTGAASTTCDYEKIEQIVGVVNTHRVWRAARDRAASLMAAHMPSLRRLAAALAFRRALNGADIRRILPRKLFTVSIPAASGLELAAAARTAPSPAFFSGELLAACGGEQP